MAVPIEQRVHNYLDQSRGLYEEGSDEYFARLALSVARDSYRGRNYGIGSVAVRRAGDRLHEFAAGNSMVTGTGLIDHAETRALLRIAEGSQSDRSYPAPINCSLGDAQIAVYGTLEPCPMCASVMTNAGVVRSVSTVRDGALARQGEYLVSDGAANVLGTKHAIQPAVWREIQEDRGLRFELLDTEDANLRKLSLEIFLKTRQQIDDVLAQRPPTGSTTSLRTFYARSIEAPEQE